MRSSKFVDHSFVVKIWLEETAEESGRVLWRGRITHVMSGDRAYFEELDAIVAFVAPYLAQMGVKMGRRRRFRKFLRRWMPP